MLRLLSRLSLVAGILLLGATAQATHTRTYHAELFGSEEVPPVTTTATGRVSLTVNQDTDTIEFIIRVHDGISLTQSHLHCGKPGENAPVIAFLSGVVPGGFDVDGELAHYTLKNSNIYLPTSQQCNPPIATIADLKQALAEGRVYANVHTMANPMGEIRGQLK